ncbi:DUF6376 family protein [Planococcus lenghuensis]|uniref:Lipoprotein n=1 Tax=Planococcus lenghuensis TaxID=2213202 RepID=A0A1Q2L0S7_9BACL|nr:DUF6376 family protein [Planococcus lenghuensis]AQQ54048.1 hypothetical protein B0X71_13690 [Planococcus lenghuensis]
MKKTMAAAFLTAAIGLSGCSLLEDVSSTVTYVSEATEYANEAQDFANEVPALAERAVTDPQAAADLKVQLEDMRQNIEEFNALEEPAVGGQLHEQAINLNERALEGIDLYLTNIEDGTLAPEVIENTEIFRTLSEVGRIVNQIQALSE